MFELDTQAEAILTALEGVDALETVGFLEDEEQRVPARMPAAFVLLEKLLADVSGKNAGADLTWAVLLKGKRMKKPTGMLPLIDAVAGAVQGLCPMENCAPLFLREVLYLEDDFEACTYILRFAGKKTAAPWVLR